MERLLVITNSGAGTADEENLEAPLSVLRSAYAVEVVATASLDDLDDALAGADGRTVVVAGGDGSLHAVVQTLHTRGELADNTLALLPLGTGNDFARTVGLPLVADEAARALMKGTVRPVDLVVADDGTVVVNHVHLGAGAQAARFGADWKEKLGSAGVGKLNLGKLGYPIGALQAAASEPVRVRIEVDGEEVADEEVLMVALGNGASVGGGAELTPDADVSDGRIDVMVSTANGPLARWAYAAAIARGDHQDRDDVTALHGTTVRITGEKFWTSADGELSGPHTERTWRVERGAFRMLLP
ncbi:diacylglycerol/lipid kinase family protein [Nocardioides jishulii]|uniref:YegS/Rv2252/BmrU family lipid kinase n=1 Tax=Nocardioides jishulii TaxID=2575440 RepID=A0A4U2YS92_9ACTN|nr:YegS/Rv2252/BmrU family lipid kinase [Nocardioides jishulii]QCX26371.1 YegS/Rv2252/BmrU family lipid kinase [Nocardioides jishulii]TKI63824.1 YegS/Rv2252/BmrU family lipid kinase [Nocardioides jishulii]